MFLYSKYRGVGGSGVLYSFQRSIFKRSRQMLCYPYSYLIHDFPSVCSYFPAQFTGVVAVWFGLYRIINYFASGHAGKGLCGVCEDLDSYDLWNIGQVLYTGKKELMQFFPLTFFNQWITYSLLSEYLAVVNAQSIQSARLSLQSSELAPLTP